MKEVKKTAADKIAAEEIEVKKTVRKTARRLRKVTTAIVTAKDRKSVV